MEQAAVQGRETGFQMGEGFSFIHSSLSSDSYRTFTVDQASDIPLMGEGVEAEDVKESRAHRREKRQRERERETQAEAKEKPAARETYRHLEIRDQVRK